MVIRLREMNVYYFAFILSINRKSTCYMVIYTNLVHVQN